MAMFKSAEAAEIKERPLEDAIYLRNPFTNVKGAGIRRYLIFFISGNPGLIEYYRTYLSYLYALLSKEHPSEEVVIEVYGRSLGGFEIKRSSIPKQKWWQRRKVYDVDQQVEFVEKALFECSHQLTRQADGNRPKVILIGHSVGTYFLMELIQRHRSRLEQFSRDGESVDSRKRSMEPDIVGGICLFPTITHIGVSPRGKLLKPLAKIPYWSHIGSTLGSIIASLIPTVLLRQIVKGSTGFTGRPLETTMAFLKSPAGVRQGLFMGCDEIIKITMDKWDTEVWGAVHPSPTKVPRPRLFFFFGEEDHWVANHTRDDLMILRARGESDDEWKPYMEIDQLEIPHAFSIGHSVPVAEKTKEYVDTIITLGENQGNGSFSLANTRLSIAQSTPRNSTIGS